MGFSDGVLMRAREIAREKGLLVAKSARLFTWLPGSLGPKWDAACQMAVDELARGVA
jgi:hypothetical protein